MNTLNSITSPSSSKAPYVEDNIESNPTNISEQEASRKNSQEVDKKRPSKSNVWEHFTKEKDKAGIFKRVKCNYCSCYYSSSSATSTLRTHVSKCPKNPSSDAYCKIQGLLLSCCKHTDPNMRLMATKMSSKFDKYWGKLDKINFMLIAAVILDPRFRLKYVKFCFDRVYDEGKVNELLQMIKEKMKALFEYYEQVHTSLQEPCNEQCNEKVDVFDMDDKLDYTQLFKMQVEEEETNSSKTELDKYLEKNVEKDDPSFDILTWWKMNASNYPILATIAKDIMALPVSTVPSESTFSYSGRILDRFRSSLTPKTVERLMCTQDWIKDVTLTFQIEEDLSTLEEIEQAVDKEDAKGKQKVT